jgi:hypothetical protein
MQRSPEVQDLSGQGKSRRFILSAGGVVIAAAAMGVAGAAQAKSPQKGVQYVEKSTKPNMNCGNCGSFIAPAACKIVDGVIAPTGYCIVWSPAPKK